MQQATYSNVNIKSTRLTNFNPVLHCVWKPVISFALQIKCLVSIWNAILDWNGLMWTMCWKLTVTTLQWRQLLSPQPAFTWSKSTMVISSKCLESVQIEQWRHQNDVNHVFLMSLLLTLNVFHTFFWYFHCWV